MERRDVAFIAIEGNIGAGKSTLLRALQKHCGSLDVAWVNEPAWEASDHDMLALFYKDPSRWAFPMQMNCLLTRMQALHSAASGSNAVVVVERSLLSDRMFAEAARDNGTITAPEFGVYKKLHEHAIRSTPPLSGIIYVTTPAAECADRIAARGTPSESGMSLPYLQSLERLHATHVADAGVPVLSISGDVSDATPAVAAFIRKVALIN